MIIYSETDSNISYFGWEIEEYPRQFGKEPEAITESFTPCVPSLGFCKKKRQTQTSCFSRCNKNCGNNTVNILLTNPCRVPLKVIPKILIYGCPNSKQFRNGFWY